MTPPDPRALLRALISELVDTGADPVTIADELLSEAVAANVVVGTRDSTAELLRRLADALDSANG